jgi:hypothetical protein
MNDAMLIARKAKPLGTTGAAHYYVNRGSIEVYCHKNGEGGMACKLTRQQLERALEIMRATSPQTTVDGAP